MSATVTDVLRIISSGYFWRSTARLAILISVALAILALAFTTLIVVLPLALVGGIALHFYLRRKFRRPSQHFSQRIIEAEYTVVEHGHDDHSGPAR